MNVSNEEYYKEIDAVIDDVRRTFAAKQKSYNPGPDPFINFRRGGSIRHGNDDFYGCYESLKDYVTKHVVNAMNKDIVAADLAESTRDIAVYMIIATAMKHLWEKQHGTKGIKNP